MNETRVSIDAHSAYRQAGVDVIKAEVALKALLGSVGKTLQLRKERGSARLPIGYFANVLDIGHDVGLAISTDGVGAKALIAQMLHKYDTIGIDCVAMNVNDIICVGAEPIALVDYIAVQAPEPELLSEIGKGLYEGARMAGVIIPGGEVAQLRDIISGYREGYGFDLVGTCIGLVSLDRIISGRSINPGDVVVGLRSSGIHSNGLSLARDVFFRKMKFSVDSYLSETGRTLGEELLEPTHIYVPEIMDMLNSGIQVKALINITSDGFLNLARADADVGYDIEYLPEPQPIFSLIQEYGAISDEEMFSVYNMGIGFCVISPADESQQVIAIARKHGVDAWVIGCAREDIEKKVFISSRQLVGVKNTFRRV